MKRNVANGAVRLAVLAGLLGLLPRTVVGQLSSADRAALADLGPTYATRYELRRGWFRGQPIRYFDIGPQDNTTAAVFLFVTGMDPDGTPHFVPGQRPVFSSLPGLESFSAIWQLHYVQVRPGYAANQVRDGRRALSMVLSGQARLILPGSWVNYSIVAEGSSLVEDPGARPLRHGWYKGAEVPYFDFGFTEREPAPIFPFVTGFSADGPEFLRAQANIVDAVPGSAAGTHDLWDVMFVEAPAGYEPDTIRDLAMLRSRGLPIRPAGQVRNCPVVLVNGQPVPRPAP